MHGGHEEHPVRGGGVGPYRVPPMHGPEEAAAAIAHEGHQRGASCRVSPIVSCADGLRQLGMRGGRRLRHLRMRGGGRQLSAMSMPDQGTLVRRQGEKKKFEEAQKQRQERIEGAGLRKFDSASTEVRGSIDRRGDRGHPPAPSLPCHTRAPGMVKHYGPPRAYHGCLYLTHCDPRHAWLAG